MKSKSHPEEGNPQEYLPAHFLNVDLEISSSRRLKPLLDAMASAVCDLQEGRVRRTWWLRVDLAKGPRSADSAIQSFAKLIEALPPEPRELWDSAKTRNLSIGIQSGMAPRGFVERLSPAAIQAAAAINASIDCTVYCPEPAEGWKAVTSSSAPASVPPKP